MAQDGTQVGAKAGFRWLGQLACALVVAGGLVVLWQVIKLIRTALLPSPTAFVQSDAGNDERVKQLATAIDNSAKQVSGRSIFYVPSKPGEAGTLPVEVAEEDEPDEATPDRYEGPAIAAIVLDEVWFAGGKRAKAGGEEVEGVKVLSTDAPWGAKVQWKSKEFEVAFYQRDRLIFKDSN